MTNLPNGSAGKKALRAFPRNPWAVVLIVDAAGGIAIAAVMAFLPPVMQHSELGLVLFAPIVLLAIVGGVGYSFVEIRRHERAEDARRGHLPKASRRIAGYAAALAVVIVLAIGASLTPHRYAAAVWAFYIPVWIVGGWWLRRRRFK